jgi:MerR family transcriptional regulator, thiopeptide resistance regulator
MTHRDDTLSIGELASAAGTTRRALHHYDEIGLLVPAQRTPSGYRRYDQADARRLRRIQTLAALGLPLHTIARVLAGAESAALIDALAGRAGHLGAQIAAQQRRRESLRGALMRLESGHHRSSLDDVIDALEVSAMPTNVQTTIAILVYHDLERVHDHLVEVFGLRPGGVRTDEAGRALHGEVFAPDGGAIWLHRSAPEHGLSSPANVDLATGGVVVLFDDVDEHYQRAVAAGASIDYPPTDQPYGLREYGARDPEGGHWYLAHMTDESAASPMSRPAPESHG